VISRRTIVFFLIAAASIGFLPYRIWEQERPCREWRRVHDFGQTDPAPVRQPDGTVNATFNPCNLWYDMPWIDKLLVLTGFSASVAFVISLIQDIVRWFKRRSVERSGGVRLER
jgi:hypothetical protein